VPKTLEKQVQLQDGHTTADNFGISNGNVYANLLASEEIQKSNPRFVAGAILVRERNDAGTDETPEAVIAMVKREKGFSKETNDWEFFAFEAKDFQLRKRETSGDCAKCHIRAEKTDWVFRDHLK